MSIERARFRRRVRPGVRAALTTAILAAVGVPLSMVAGCTFLTDLDGLSTGSVDAASAVDARTEAAPQTGDGAAGSDAPSDASFDGSTCVAVATGLVGHWTFDTSYIQGSLVHDSSGKANDGMLVGTPPPIVVAGGHSGDALDYSSAPDTAGAHVLVPSLPLDLGASGVTSVSLWFFRSGASGIDDVLVDMPDSPRFDLWLTGDTGHLLCFNTQANECWGIDDPNLRDRWVHVVALFHNGVETESELYVDGTKRVLACTTDPKFPCNVSRTVGLPLSLGGQNDYFFHGRLDDVRVYNRALTAAEVAALYAGTACP